MPSYVSHTIMARDVYKKVNNKNINLDYMITYSLGGDLSKYSKCRKDCHRVKTEEFISNLIEYMKINHLENDGECLGVLYGHICHLTMDSVIHPLVYKMSSICLKNKSNHTMIELYYDNYLSNKHFNRKLNKYDNRLLFKGKMNKKVSNMINYAYNKTYNCNNISRYYKFNIWLYKKIKYLYKLFSLNFLKKVSGMNKFLNNNSNIDLINKDHKIIYKLYNKDCNDDLDTLYNKSINESIKYIKKVNI